MLERSGKLSVVKGEQGEALTAPASEGTEGAEPGWTLQSSGMAIE